MYRPRILCLLWRNFCANFKRPTCLTNGAQFILSVFFRLTGCIAYMANVFFIYLALMLTTVLKAELAVLFTLLTAFTL